MEQSLQVMSKQERLEIWTARIMACRSSGTILLRRGQLRIGIDGVARTEARQGAQGFRLQTALEHSSVSIGRNGAVGSGVCISLVTLVVI